MKAPVKPLSLLLRTLPDRVHSELLSRLFNHLLRGQRLADQLVARPKSPAPAFGNTRSA